MSEKSEDQLLEELLGTMREQGLPVQRGGFEIEAIPTGVVSFDRATGVGGVPRRRISVFQGEEASGKTLLLLILIANVQKAGGRAAFVDLEHALTPSFAELLDVSYDDLVISRPRTLEQAYDVARGFANSGLFDVVGFDSAVALATEADLEKSATEGTKRASQAQVHSEELKKMTSDIHDRTAFVLINQIREDPNPPGWWTGGKRFYSPGGRAIGHYCSLRVDIKATKNYKDASRRRVGHRVMMRISKNKVAQPWATAEFDIMYATGIDLVVGLIDTAVDMKIIRRRSSWFYFDSVNGDGEVIEEYRWNGRTAMEDDIREDVGLQNHIQEQIALEGGNIAQDYEVEEQDLKGWQEVDE